MKNILFISREEKKPLSDSFFQLLNATLKISQKTSGKKYAVLLSASAETAEEAAFFSLDEVFFSKEKMLKDNDFAANQLAMFIKEKEIEYVLFPASDLMKALSARLCAKLNCGLMSDLTEINMDEKISGIKPAFGKDICAKIFTKSQIKAFSIKFQNKIIFEKTLEKSGLFDFPFKKEFSALTETISEEKLPQKRKSIENSKTVIAVGKGVKKEDLPLIEKLSGLLNAAIGFTRPAVYDGLGEHDQQIGVTGKTIAPQIYIAIGLSGKSHHLNGLKGNPVIISVNTDVLAPINEICDYKVIGDYKETIKTLISELEKHS